MRKGNKDFAIANLGYRIGLYHPGYHVQIGTGNTNADVLVIQPHTKMPPRDAITGALKNFGMLSDAYRATMHIIDHPSDLTADDRKLNRYYLKELIGIIQPLIVVTCGPEVTGLLRERKIRSFQSHTGKRFRVNDLTNCVFYATLNPTEYGYARAPQSLKRQGKVEWTKLAELYKKLKTKQERERWAC